ncbi:uncharacterized protein LOC135466202 [Liolophura sinensis]|uniref:uncharacterized protein LOC135466202 n=1 Tax=Liolophura sinensis TaxID=3198878 RepID=UPI0031587BB3
MVYLYILELSYVGYVIFVCRGLHVSVYAEDVFGMANVALTSQEEADELDRCFREFVSLTFTERRPTPEEKEHMNIKACAKLVKDCLPKEVVGIADYIFPRFRERGIKQTMAVSNFLPFIEECAFEYAKLKTKDTKLAKDNPAVGKYFMEFKKDIIRFSPNIPKVKERVAGLEDTSIE